MSRTRRRFSILPLAAALLLLAGMGAILMPVLQMDREIRRDVGIMRSFGKRQDFPPKRLPGCPMRMPKGTRLIAGSSHLPRPLTGSPERTLRRVRRRTAILSHGCPSPERPSTIPLCVPAIRIIT